VANDTIPDEQALEDWGRLLQRSEKEGKLLTIHVYDPFDEIVVTGHVAKIDIFQKRILFIHGKKTWIPIIDIVNISSF